MHDVAKQTDILNPDYICQRLYDRGAMLSLMRMQQIQKHIFILKSVCF